VSTKKRRSSEEKSIINFRRFCVEEGGSVSVFSSKMASLIGSLLKKVFPQKREACALLLALDNAGRTTWLYSMKTGEVIKNTIHTIGFNVETIHGSTDMVVWDVGGCDKVCFQVALFGAHGKEQDSAAVAPLFCQHGRGLFLCRFLRFGTTRGG
jgi:GTPase SAR1 family protein